MVAVLTQPNAVELPNWSYQLAAYDPAYDDDIIFGRGTDIHVEKVDMGEIAIAANVVDNARADGVRFSRDYYRGRTITFEGNIYTASSQPGETDATPMAIEAMTSAWSPEHLRLTPGAVTSLRMNRGGKRRRVFGRPRKFLPELGKVSRGWAPYSATFECVDHYFYSDSENSQVIPYVPTSVGGLIGPLIGPIISSSPSTGTGQINVVGTKPSWLGFKIYGPIAGPIIEVTDQWYAAFDITIAYDEYLVVEPSPWLRTVRMNDGSNAAGSLTANSARLSEMRVYPGPNQVLLRGTDPTGTARIETYWRDTYSSAQ